MANRQKKKRRARLSPAERQQQARERQFRNNIRTVFTNAGFEQIPTRDVQVDIAGRKGDFDALFIHDNVLVIVEDTTLASASLGDHLRKKAEFFRHLAMQQDKMFAALAALFPRFATYLEEHAEYDIDEYVVRFVYCSRYAVEDAYRHRYEKDCTVLAFTQLLYFLNLTRAIRRSARFELFKFLKVDLSEIGPSSSGIETTQYQALLLPEVPSGFPTGHKLVSFLVDPHTLLERAYVLRRDSWRDQDALYQRLLVRGKVASMREYLVSEGRVFVNNIIVTLPDDTRFDADRHSTGRSTIATISPGRLTIPKRFNAIGIIDGQHRVFAYHEGDDKYEKRIAALRDKQHLLVTGIIYPESISSSKATQFEAKLFLEINDKQKRVRGDLKQSIERIVRPYSAIAIAKAVVERLGATGPLADLLQVHFFDNGKIKTASIVSYGLRHIVPIHGEHSFFSSWPGPGKTALREKRSVDALNNYIAYCAMQLNLLISGFKGALGGTLWTPNLKESRALTTTTLNGLIFCMRLLIENEKLGQDFEYYRKRFGNMTIDFRPGNFRYRSSHWRALGTALYAECFA